MAASGIMRRSCRSSCGDAYAAGTSTTPTSWWRGAPTVPSPGRRQSQTASASRSTTARQPGAGSPPQPPLTFRGAPMTASTVRTHRVSAFLSPTLRAPPHWPRGRSYHRAIRPAAAGACNGTCASQKHSMSGPQQRWRRWRVCARAGSVAGALLWLLGRRFRRFI